MKQQLFFLKPCPTFDRFLLLLFFFSSLFFKSSPPRRLPIERKKLMKIFRLNMWNKEKKKLVYNLCNPLFTFYSLCPNRVRPVYQRAGHINWTFPGPMFVGTNGKQRYTSAIVTQCPRTSTYRWFLPIIVRKITKVLRHFERKRTRIHLRTVHRNRSCSVAITNSLPRGVRVLSLPIYLVFKADMSKMSRYDVPSTRNSGIIDPNVQEALEFDSL